MGITYLWRQRRRKGTGHVLLVALIYGGVSLLWLLGIPAVIGRPIWTSMRFYHPELAYGLILGAAIGIGWSLINAVIHLRSQPPGGDLPPEG